MKILITGGAGFIGSNLARYALAQDARNEVRVLDDLSTGYLQNLDGIDVEFIEGSILDPVALDRATTGVDAIVHLGAIPSVPRSLADPVRSHLANATGTLAVLEAARAHGSPYVVVASSSSVYGSNPVLPKAENAWTRPLSPYAVSKLATEAYAIAYGYSYGLKTLAFRFFNVYGPGQAAGHAYAAVVPQFLDAALSGRPIPLDGDGSQSRDFTFVGSVCAAIYDAVDRQVVSESPVNLAFGTRTTLLELIDEIERISGRTVEIARRPSRVGDVYASQADGSLLASLFPGIGPTPLADGLAATVDWFRRAETTG